MTMLRRIELSLSCILLLTSCLMAQGFLPAPFLNQPSVPDHVVPGSPDTQIVISGTNLLTDDSFGGLTWNGTPLNFNLVGKQLVATIPASLLTVAKTAQIQYENNCDYKCYLSPSNLLYFTVGPSTKNLSSSWNRHNYVVGGQTERQAVADLNSDGILDIVSVDTQNNAVRVLMAGPRGTFQNPVSYSTGNGPSGLVLSPLMAAGPPLCLAVTNYNDGTVSVFINNGNGLLQNRVDYPVGRGPVALASGDFESDGSYDLAVVNSLDNTVTILSNASGADFTTLQTLATGPNPSAITVGDFDGDGQLDLAVTNFGNYAGNTLSIFYGLGGGHFSPKVDLTTDAGPQSVIAADLNGDGILDLVTANGCGHAATCGNPGTVSVLLGNGNRTFQNAVNYNAGSYPFAVVAANFRNNRYGLDLAVTDLDSGNIDILYGTGHGTFTQGPLIPTNSRPTGLAVGDFNNDGKLDLVVGGTSPSQVTIMTQP